MKKNWMMMYALCVGMASCNSGKQMTGLEEADCVAYKSDVTICEFKKLDVENELALPLSSLAECPRIVKLDNRDEATAKGGMITVSEHYILMGRVDDIPAKLFKKTGEFVGCVGGFGSGLGEYRFVYDQQIDEARGRIYLFPWFGFNAVFEYDLQGKFVRNIPLAKKYPDMSFPKVKFRVEADKDRLTAFVLPFENLPVMAWTQDLDGNIIDEVPIPKQMKLKPDFSNEIIALHCTDEFSAYSFRFFNNEGDFLYHYQDGRLVPVFGVDFGDYDTPMHVLAELPRHYLGNTAKPKQLSEHLWVGDEHRDFIIDKETMKGNYFYLVNDYWGDTELPGAIGACGRGYYQCFYAPADMRALLAKALKSESLDKNVRSELQNVLDGIDDNDNGYVVYAKIKE